MNADTYSGWSLDDLKSAAADLDVAALSKHAETFARGERALESVQDSFAAALGYLAGGWSGAAAQAAAGNAQASISKITNTQGQTAASNSQTQAYVAETRRQQTSVAAIPDVDTGWGHAFSSGAMGGLAGVALAKFRQHQEYEKQRARAVKLVGQIDARGEEQASEMRGQDWLKPSATSEKPKQLQPPSSRGSDTKAAGGKAHDERVSSTSGRTPRGAVDDTVSASRSDGHGIQSVPHLIDREVSPAGAQQPAAAAPVALPTLLEQTTTASGTAGTGGGSGVAGGAALVAGGAALAAGSSRFGRAAMPSPDGFANNRGPSGRTAGAPEPGAANGRASGGPHSGGLAGLSEPGAPGSGVASGRAPTTEVSMRTSGGAGAGFPPVGPGGQRRDEDDELKARPEYLVEPDDIWGDGRLASPPVLG